MDNPLAIGSWPSSYRARTLASRGTLDSYAAAVSEAQSAAAQSARVPPDSATATAQADDRQRMMHFISHIDASCFIALLQVLDPMPDDYRARAEYRRFYRELHETLEVPLPPGDDQQLALAGDLGKP